MISLRLAVPGPALFHLGPCFLCRRSGAETVRIGTMASPGGPGHRAYETPLCACRDCLGYLLAMHHAAHADPARRCLAPGHPC
ncbi:hypothetical protein [Streptomyces hebeiensis]